LTTAQAIQKRISGIVSKEDYWRGHPSHVVSYSRKITKCDGKNT